MIGKPFALFLFAAVTIVHANDWPTYRHDNRRSGVSQEQLPVQLKEAWVYKSSAPPRPLGRDRRNGMLIPVTRTCSPCGILILHSL